MKRFFLFALPVVVVLGLITFLSPFAGAQPGKRWHMQIAVEELREARKGLKESRHDFGGHREKAIFAIDEAIIQIEKTIPFIK
jgi:hypothetical protein